MKLSAVTRGSMLSGMFSRGSNMYRFTLGPSKLTPVLGTSQIRSRLLGLLYYDEDLFECG